MEKIFFQLGDETIELAVSFTKEASVVYLNLHENEHTSVEAAKAILPCANGILCELRSKKERLITFTKNRHTYIFDPNRMFSDEGIKMSLEEYSSYNGEAAHAVSSFAEQFIQKILSYQPRWIIALHNTSGEYSIEGYRAGGPYEKDAAELFINPLYHPGDFFFTSDAPAYQGIRDKGFNVVLQNNKAVTEDGSLSVYCGKNNIRYINCEALHGHRAEQEEMLSFISSRVQTEF